ncbi:MAG: long-chain-fatty-acid--CoA ligase [Myxococcota bacterium]
MLGLMMDEPLLISKQLEFAAKFHPNVEIVTRTVEGPIQRSSYGELSRRAKQLAASLQARGIRPGDRIATIAWNTQRHMELYYAVSGMGAVLHTINPRLSPEQLKYVVGHARDRALFFDITFAPLAAAVAKMKLGVEFLFALTDDAGLQNVEVDAEAFENLFTGLDFEWPRLDERTASSLCYTSGTTGEPKGVLYSHRSTVLHSYGVCMSDSLGLSARDVTLPVVPMFHVNAWGVPYAATMVGSKLVMPGPGLDGPRLTELIEGEAVTSLLGVPSVWMNLLGHYQQEGKRMERVEKVVIGGSAAPPSMIRAFEQQHDVRVIHAWGMTEISPLGTANLPLAKHVDLPEESRLKRLEKQGRPIFGVDLRIIDDTDTPLPHDGKTTGHLQVRGPWVASAYFERPSEGEHRDGWFHTGDIASIDPDGYVLITDRSKDVIKSGGEWISSIELENTASLHPAVKQAAVIGVRHEKWQERPLLLVVPHQEAPSAEELLAFMQERIPKWWLPDRVEFVDALPLGATGKVLKRELRNRYGDLVLR